MAIVQDPNILYSIIYIIPIYLMLESIILGLTLWLGKIKIVKWNIVYLLFSSPLPAVIILFYYWSSFSTKETPKTYKHNINGHRLKEVSYLNTNSKIKRIEYWTSFDSISNDNPFPASDNYCLDSIIYFKDSYQIYKKEIYKNGQLIK